MRYLTDKTTAGEVIQWHGNDSLDCVLKEPEAFLLIAPYGVTCPRCGWKAIDQPLRRSSNEQ